MLLKGGQSRGLDSVEQHLLLSSRVLWLFSGSTARHNQNDLLATLCPSWCNFHSERRKLKPKVIYFRTIMGPSHWHKICKWTGSTFAKLFMDFEEWVQWHMVSFGIIVSCHFSEDRWMKDQRVTIVFIPEVIFQHTKWLKCVSLPHFHVYISWIRSWMKPNHVTWPGRRAQSFR